jgi:hypothetical protein
MRSVPPCGRDCVKTMKRVENKEFTTSDGGEIKLKR